MPSSVPTLLDVRLVPADRVLGSVRALARKLRTGESFVLVYDENPLSLCRALRREHGVAVHCTLLHQTAHLWFVRVLKYAS